MPSSEDIAQQQELLSAHRKTLAFYLHQQAISGSTHTPPATAHGIHEARQNIQRIKTILYKWGIMIENLPNDLDMNQPKRSFQQNQDAVTGSVGHTQKLLVIHKRRLQVLEEQAAFFGTLCPPHIVTEIEMLKETIKQLEQTI